MKKLAGLLVVLVFIIGCNNVTAPKAEAPAKSEAKTEAKAEVKGEVKAEVPANAVRINYKRFDGKYEGWGLHIWGDGYAGTPVEWGAPVAPTGKTAYGVYWDIPINGNSEVNFIIHNGDNKDPDGDRSFPKPGVNKEIFAITGEAKAYMSAKETEEALNNKIESAVITGENEIKVRFKLPAKEEIVIKSGDKKVAVAHNIRSGSSNIIKMVDALDTSKEYTVVSGNLSMKVGLSWEGIDAKYTYNGELGSFYKKEATEFKLWAPLASAVKVKLFNKGNDAEPYKVVDMKSGEKGIWTTTVAGDIYGNFYQYDVTNNGVTKTVLDPYAKSMAAFDADSKDKIGKAAVVDTSKLGPKLDYAKIDGFTKREDTIIWEIHVRDLTSDPALATKAQFGTYKAFIEKLDYIKSLGVTHIQLLPVMNYYYGNEAGNAKRELEYSTSGNNYNWGYDPHNYFTPEGMYSENPADPAARVAELKELIKEAHKRGIGIILDCVYNHTAKLSILEDIVPGYYHFMDSKGRPKLAYGGGRPGTTHAMTRKLVIDSMKYWTDEYKVDGFRFDLMGDLDGETVQMAYDEVAKLNPKTVFLGEGWSTYTGDDGDRRQPADQSWMDKTDSVGVFSDEFRNELKSGYGSEGQPRFITGGKRSIRTIFNNVLGKPSNTKSDDPGDMVQYIEAHDNLTLHDVIAQSIKKDPDIAADEKEIHQRIRLGNTIIMTSQGIAFLHAGQEFGRTKQWLSDKKPKGDATEIKGNKNPWFVHNSYDSSDIINKIDWSKTTNPGVNKDTLEYTKGIIALRKSTDAFRLGSAALVKENVKLIESADIKSSDNIIGYEAKATTGETYYVFINGDNVKRTLNIGVDLTAGNVIADSDEAGTAPVSKVSGVEITANTVAIDPLTAVIIKK